MKNIAAALVKAQREFAPALKTSINPHFKSRYVGLDGCIEAVIDALNNNGVALIQRNHDCADGVKVETILLHESGEEYSGGVLHVPAIKSDPQAFGSALTYARRYSLMATCGIAPEDDDGNAASKPKSSPALKADYAPVSKAPVAPLLQPPPEALTKAIQAITTATDMDALRGHYNAATALYGATPDIIAAKDSRKQTLALIDAPTTKEN